jgi:hypothetical protein
MLTPSLTMQEKQVVKALLNKGERNQDIHALINTGREPTVNFGRISTIKKSKIQPASDAEVAKFKFERSLSDLKTGLAPFRDERLVRAREAMLLAVNIFNMPLLRFKVEVFSVLANIAWTYLLHEFYDTRGVKIINAEGNSLLLSQMLKRPDFPLSKGVADNLRALEIIRDEVEHRILNSIGQTFYSIFQASCLNFEKAICSLFGDRLSLGSELQYALQFSKLSMEQAVATQGFDAEGPVKAIDAKLAQTFSEDEMADPQFRFKVTYALEKASKADAHFSFANKLGDGEAPHNVLIQKIAADENWPHKPSIVVKLVTQKTGKKFTSHNHTQAWRKFGVRPKWGAGKPEATNKKFCTYHPAHKDYTYSEDWVDHLCQLVDDEDQFSEVTSFKI